MNFPSFMASWSPYKTNSRHYFHRHSNPDELHQVFRVPICEPETAVRFRVTDLLRAGRAVHAVAWLVQTDPRDAHGIVRTRSEEQFVPDGLGLRRFGKNGRVKRVIRR